GREDRWRCKSAACGSCGLTESRQPGSGGGVEQLLAIVEPGLFLRNRCEPVRRKWLRSVDSPNFPQFGVLGGGKLATSNLELGRKPEQSEKRRPATRSGESGAQFRATEVSRRLEIALQRSADRTLGTGVIAAVRRLGRRKSAPDHATIPGR